MQILGYTNFAVPMDALAQGYADLLAHATAGRITIDIEAVPLAQVAEASVPAAAGLSCEARARSRPTPQKRYNL